MPRVPFAAALFAVRPRLRAIAEERYPTTQRFLRELSCGVAAAAVAGPASHAPSVVAAYQQATDVRRRGEPWPTSTRRADSPILPGPTRADAARSPGPLRLYPLALDRFAVQRSRCLSFAV